MCVYMMIFTPRVYIFWRGIVSMKKSEMYYENENDIQVSDGIQYSADSDSAEPVKIVTRTKINKKSGKTANSEKKRMSRDVRAEKAVNTGKQKKSGIKEAIKNIHHIESESEYDKVKLAKKKIADREAELKRRQLPNVPSSKAFRPTDIQRIVQHTTTSIFDKEDCALWTGYITNLQNRRKGTYVNFYFRNKKKVALHRLLYANFKGEINAAEYIKYSCSNKGRCCNVNHMVKFEYNSGEVEEENDDVVNKQIDKNMGNDKENGADKSNKKTKSKSASKKSAPKKLEPANFKISIY